MAARTGLKWHATVYGLDDTVERALKVRGAPEYILNADMPQAPLWFTKNMHPVERAKVREKARAQSQVIRDWGDSFLANVVGLPLNMRNTLAYDSLSRTSMNLLDDPEDRDMQVVYHPAYREMLADTTQVAQELGIDKLKVLRNELGFVNFNYFESDQLELMYNLARGDEETIKHLQDGDVTVVLSQTSKDWNGAIKKTARNFASKQGRTVVFEVRQPEDYMQYKDLLDKWGIKASLIVFSNHGDQGYFVAGAAYKRYKRVPTVTKSGDTVYTQIPEIHPASVITSGVAHGVVSAKTEDQTDKRHISLYRIRKYIAEFVENSMQPSRGIDEPAEVIGMRRIILDFCYGAEEVLYPITQTPRRRSLAETVARVVHHPELAVYANRGSSSMVRDKEAVRFQGNERGDKPAITRPLAVVEYRVDIIGRMQRRELYEIPVEKSDDDGGYEYDRW